MDPKPGLYATKLAIFIPATLAELGREVLTDDERASAARWAVARIEEHRRVLALLEAVAHEHPALARLAAAHRPRDVEQAYAECTTCIEGEAGDPSWWPCDVVDLILDRPMDA